MTSPRPDPSPRLIAAAEALNGNFDQACKDCRLAIDLLAKGPYRPELALARLGLAELLLDHYPRSGPRPSGCRTPLSATSVR